MRTIERGDRVVARGVARTDDDWDVGIVNRTFDDGRVAVYWARADVMYVEHSRNLRLAEDDEDLEPRHTLPTNADLLAQRYLELYPDAE